jgi:energy-coupling factor transporter ATP-binding protein EcfA2
VEIHVANLSEHPRIVVVGSSGSGKTHLARALAERLGREHIELDRLHWGENWSRLPDFRARVEALVARDAWIIEGNYRAVRELVWSRATAIVWLNYSILVALRRAAARSVRRILRRERLWGGNRETFRRAFLSHEGPVLWILQSHHRRRRQFREMLASDRYKHLTLFEARHPRDVAAIFRE